MLDAVQVHGDAADVAREEHPVAAADRDADLLAVGGALEDERVEAGIALDGIAAVARIPQEDVVAGAEEGGIGAAIAVDGVVARAAHQDVVMVAADDRVVAGAAVDRHAGGEAIADDDEVVAATGIEDDRFDRTGADRGLQGIEDVDADASEMRGDRKTLDAVAAIDFERVEAEAAADQSLPSPAFQMMRSLPLPPEMSSSPAPPASTSLPPPPESTSLPASPKSWSSPAPPLMVSSPPPPERIALGRAPLVSSRVMTSLPSRPSTWMRLVSPMVGGPPSTLTSAVVDEDRARGIRSDGDRVVEAVALHRQYAGTRDETSRDCHLSHSFWVLIGTGVRSGRSNGRGRGFPSPPGVAAREAQPRQLTPQSAPPARDPAATPGRGVTRFAALAYGASHPDLAGIVAMGPAGDPADLTRAPTLATSVKLAGTLVKAGKGNTVADFNDVVTGDVPVPVAATPEAFLSFHGPDSPIATMKRVIAKLLPQIKLPVLWIAGTHDPSQASAAQGFAKIPKNKLNRLATVDADHGGTPDASAEALTGWLATLQ